MKRQDVRRPQDKQIDRQIEGAKAFCRMTFGWTTLGRKLWKYEYYDVYNNDYSSIIDIYFYENILYS